MNRNSLLLVARPSTAAAMASRLFLPSMNGSGLSNSSHNCRGSAQLTARISAAARVNGFANANRDGRSAAALRSLTTATQFCADQTPPSPSQGFTSTGTSGRLASWSSLRDAPRSLQLAFRTRISPRRSLHTSAKMNGPVVSIETMNRNLRVMEYAVRGPIVIRAGEIERQLKEKVSECVNE